MGKIDSNDQSRRMLRISGVPASTVARYQRSTEMKIPRIAFQRLVKEIVKDTGLSDGPKFQAATLEALQLASEHYLTELFSDVNLATAHAKRITIHPKDILLAKKIRGDKPY